MKRMLLPTGLTVCLLTGLAENVRATETKSRHFEFTYTCHIRDVPQDATNVDLWMPVPSDCRGQRVHQVEVAWPPHARINRESTYGNRMLYARFSRPWKDDQKLRAEMRFDVTRDEVVVAQAKRLAGSSHRVPSPSLEVYLQANHLIPLDGKITAIAEALKLPQGDTLKTARAIYDHLIETMHYNWKAPGAGRGDVRWACDSKTGDCTDYHSMFLALCRNQGIPADHQFGFPLPTNRRSGRISHFHCWARFWVPRVGWVPIDASEADKHPELLDYNFGSWTMNLLKMTHGRDVLLNPPQQGEPINIFVYPYVEVDGHPHAGVTWTASFRDLPGSK